MSTRADTSTHPAPQELWIQQRLQQGLAFLNAGRIADAFACAHEVLRAEPEAPDAHFLIGLISQRTGEYERALQAFEQVTKIQPQLCPSWAHFAEELVRAGDYDNAVDAISEAINCDDGNPMVHQEIGLVLSSINDYSGALAWHEKSAAAVPNHVGFLLNLATCQLFVGQLDAAESSIRKLLSIQPGQANAHWLLASLKKAKNSDHIKEIEELIDSGRYEEPGLAMLQYARGKEFEDLGEWNKAFDAFVAGAKAKRSSVEYDESAEIELFDALAECCTSEWLADGEGYDSSAPIFVVGQPRSGTTLVERLLTAHSQVHSAGELRQFEGCMAQLVGKPYGSRLTAQIVEAGRKIVPLDLGKAYLDSTKQFRGTTKHFIDKRPLNCLLIPFILKALPNARILHLTRGAMDTCFSEFKQLFTNAYPHSYDLRETGRHFARYYRLMRVWRDRFGDRFIDVSYEDITVDFETIARNLIRYVGLAWEDACISFDKQTTPVATASAVQVREAVHTKSIGRWRKHEAGLQAIAKELIEADVPLEN